MATYEYSVSVDFTSLVTPAPHATLLTREITDDPGVTTTTDGVVVRADQVFILFPTALTVGEQTALDAVVAAHTGQLPEDNDSSQPRTITTDVPPTGTNDSDSGAGIGTVWVNFTDKTVYVCVNDTPGSAEWVQVEVDASAVYGELYEDDEAGTTSILVSPASTWNKWNTSSAGDVSAELTADTANDRLVVGAGGAGTYWVAAFAAIHTSGNAVTKMQLRLNGSELSTGFKTADQKSAGQRLDLGFSGVLQLAEGDYLELWFTSDSNNTTLTLYQVNVSAVKLEGSTGPQGPQGPAGNNKVNLKDEGALVANTPHSTLNFVGAGVTVADNGDGSANVTIGGGAGHVVQDEGVTLTARTNLNFVGQGVTVTDDAGNDATVVTVAGGVGDGLLIEAEKGTAGTISVGQVVYVDGFDVGSSLPVVELADASSAATMPAIGIASSAITNNASGNVVFAGRLSGLDTSGFSVGDELFVSETPGAVTVTKPTGTALIQKIGQVLRSHGSNGVIEVFGAGRSNDLPNLPTGNVWLGDGSSVPVATSRSGIDDTALHTDVAGEITALPLVAAAGSDYLLIEDASDSNSKKRVAASAFLGGGSSITVEDEGTPLTTAVTKMNFVGAGVTVTEPATDEVLVTIPGGGGGGGNLDGGEPGTNYGGITAIDGGVP